MNLSLLGALALMLLCVPSAYSQFSSIATASSDYDFRGISLCAKKPALQASAEYSFASGFAVGAWASNVDFGDKADIEVDLHADFTTKLSDKWSWTAGAAHCQWPKSVVVSNCGEAFLGVSYGC